MSCFVSLWQRCAWADLRPGEDGPWSVVPTEHCHFTACGKVWALGVIQTVGCADWNARYHNLPHQLCCRLIQRRKMLSPWNHIKQTENRWVFPPCGSHYSADSWTTAWLFVYLSKGTDVIIFLWHVDVRGNKIRLLREGDKTHFSVQEV